MPIAMNAFSVTGIWPCNPHIFSDSDFIAAETTKQSNIEDSQDLLDSIDKIPRCATSEEQIMMPSCSDMLMLKILQHLQICQCHLNYFNLEQFCLFPMPEMMAKRKKKLYK